MKKFFVTLCAALVALAFISTQAASMKKSSASKVDNSALTGQWVNKSSRLVKIIIKKNSLNDLSINVFGKCHPTDCVWGNVPLTTYGTSIMDKKMVYGLAVWKMHRANWHPNTFIDTTMTIKKLNTNEIRVTTFTVFKDNSGRSNYVSNDTLKRVK